MPSAFLTPKEREAYDAVPDDISYRQVVQHFTITPDDLAETNLCRRKAHRFGFALQICYLRWLGRFPDNVKAAPAATLQFLSDQLDLPSEALSEYSEQTRIARIHRERICQHLGYRDFSCYHEEAAAWLLPLAREHDFARRLLDALIEHLRQEKIVRPGISTLERLVTQVRDQAQDEIQDAIEAQLSEIQQQSLDTLLQVPSGETFSRLQWLKAPPPKAMAKSLLEWLEKIEACRSLGIDQLDLTSLHPNRLKLLARRARRKSNSALAGMGASERHTLLACLLHENLHDLTDQAIEMHAQLIGRTFRRAAGRRDKEFAKKGKRINEKVLLLERIGSIILDEKVTDAEIRQAIYRYVSKEQLVQAVAECSELSQPSDYNSLAYAVKSFPHLRQFTPRFLEVIHFDSDQKPTPLLEAVAFMRQFNVEGCRKLDDAPADFVPWRWKKHVVSKGQVVNRALYEMCLSECLVQAVDNGQLWVEGSREHVSFRRDWIADEEWPAARRAFLSKYPQQADVSHYLAQQRQSLNERMSEVDRQWPELEDQVEIVDGSIHLSRLEALAEPEGTASLRATIQRLFPRRTLPELLVEVNGWTGFADHLTSLNPQVRQIPHLTARKLAAVMALGMNIGLENMANAVAGMSYEELVWVADWYIREDTLRQAIVELVNFLTRMPVSRHWGDGTTSSSDGQLFGVQARTLYARVNPHAPERGTSMNVYTHVADNLSPFYSRLIESTAGEAAYILDGLLYHETDLRPREHYADTKGYTDALFGLCHLLGFRFAPRLRDLSERRLFRMRRNLDEYPNIKPLFFEKGSTRLINTRAVHEGWDDLLRLAASVENGVMPASRALRKLSAHHPESQLYKALREVGRIDKTLFLLSYISDLALRRRVLVGLNKGESYHALARSLVIVLGDALRLRSIEDQVNQITCLRLLATAIIVWDAVYMERAVEVLRRANYEIGDAQISHIYPMMLEHLNLIGEYRFPVDGRALTKLDALPLRSLDEALSQLSLGL